METLEIALESGSKPEIYHSDQRCVFTSSDLLATLQAEEIKISQQRGSIAKIIFSSNAYG
jgi:putative transposase